MLDKKVAPFNAVDGERAHDFSVQQVISKDQGQALANEYAIKFLETSAKSNINVEEAFFTLAR